MQQHLTGRQDDKAPRTQTATPAMDVVGRIEAGAILDPLVAIRVSAFTPEIFREILRIYSETVGANLTAAFIDRYVDTDFYYRKEALQRGASSVEWRLGSQLDSQSKLKGAVAFERQKPLNDSAIYFYFDSNLMGNGDLPVTNIRNAFQTKVDQYLKTTDGWIPLRDLEVSSRT